MESDRRIVDQPTPEANENLRAWPGRGCIRERRPTIGREGATPPPGGLRPQHHDEDQDLPTLGFVLLPWILPINRIATPLGRRRCQQGGRGGL